MARRNKKLKIPKERNFAAAAVRDPNGLYRPKSIPSLKMEKLPRKRKHKGPRPDEV